jgi:hypothetical protein
MNFYQSEPFPADYSAGFHPEENSRDQAIHQVEKNNSPNPLEEAFEDAVSILNSMRQGDHVASDVVVPDLKKYSFTDNRVAGVIMLKLLRAGHITPHPMNLRRPSSRTGNHRIPLRVYTNNLGR